MNIKIENSKAVAPCVFTRKAFSSALREAGYFEDGNVHRDHGYMPSEQPCVWCRVKKIVLFDDPDSVSLVDAKVWRNEETGTAFIQQGPNAEKQAREDAATHKRCNTCSDLYRKNDYCSTCATCREKARINRQGVVKYVEQPCFIGENWLFDPYSLRDYLLENDILPQDAKVEEAEPQNLSTIDLDHWHDELPEDYDESSVHSEILKALYALNSAIEKHGKGVSYLGSGNRIELPHDFIESVESTQ